MKEKTLRQKIQNDMKERNILCWHFASLGNGGFPDLLICHNDKTLFIETKGNHATWAAMFKAWEYLQQHEAKRLTAAGFSYWLIGSHDRTILFSEPNSKDNFKIETDYQYILTKILLYIGAA